MIAAIVDFVFADREQCSKEANEIRQGKFGCFCDKLFDIGLVEIATIVSDNNGKIIFAGISIFFSCFGAYELADEQQDYFPLLIKVLSKFSSPLKHCLH